MLLNHCLPWGTILAERDRIEHAATAATVAGSGAMGTAGESLAAPLSLTRSVSTSTPKFHPDTGTPSSPRPVTPEIAGSSPFRSRDRIREIERQACMHARMSFVAEPVMVEVYVSVSQ